MAILAVTGHLACRGEKRLSQIMTEQAALCGMTNGVIPLSSHLPQEERWCDLCVYPFVCVLYMQICVF